MMPGIEEMVMNHRPSLRVCAHHSMGIANRSMMICFSYGSTVGDCHEEGAAISLCVKRYFQCHMNRLDMPAPKKMNTLCLLC